MPDNMPDIFLRYFLGRQDMSDICLRYAWDIYTLDIPKVYLMYNWYVSEVYSIFTGDVLEI